VNLDVTILRASPHITAVIAQVRYKTGRMKFMGGGPFRWGCRIQLPRVESILLHGTGSCWEASAFFSKYLALTRDSGFAGAVSQCPSGGCSGRLRWQHIAAGIGHLTDMEIVKPKDA